MFHRLFRSHSSHICTFFQFPHIVGVGACAVEHLGSERRNKPVRVGMQRRFEAVLERLAPPGVGRDLAYHAVEGNRPIAREGDVAACREDAAPDTHAAYLDPVGMASREGRSG